MVLPKILQDFSVPKRKVSMSPENFKFEKKRTIKFTDTFDMISNWFSSVSSLDNNLSSCMNPYKDLHIITLQIYDNVNMTCIRFLPKLQENYQGIEKYVDKICNNKFSTKIAFLAKSVIKLTLQDKNYTK